MKRVILLVCVFILMFSTLACAATSAQSAIRVVVNQDDVNFPDEKPYIDENSRTQTPARFIGEALGAEVTWDQASQTASFVKGSNKLELYIGKREYTLNSQIKQMDTEAILLNGRTFVPARYVAEAFGATVKWDAKERTVYITLPYEDLYPVMNGEDKWGYIDSLGNVVIDYQYDNANFFNDGAAIVNINDKDALIGLDGEYLISPVEYLSSAGEGWYKVRITDGLEYKYGLADKSGKIYYNQKLKNTDEWFADGLIPFYDDEGMYGYMDASCEVVIEPQYTQAYHFSEGLAAVANDDGKYGYIDKNGKLVIPYRFDYDSIDTYTHHAFSEGFAVVEENYKYGFIDKAGYYLNEPVFDYAEPFSDGTALVLKDGLYGYIDTNGDYILEPQFADASSFKNGYAYARAINGENAQDESDSYFYGIIDKNGRFILPQVYLYEKDGGGFTFNLMWITGFDGVLARVVLSDENGLDYAYINEKGEIIWRMSES